MTAVFLQMKVVHHFKLVIKKWLKTPFPYYIVYDWSKRILGIRVR
jgi:hypothetical protein